MVFGDFSMIIWTLIHLLLVRPVYSDPAKFQLNDPPFFTVTFEEIENLQEPLFSGAVNQKDVYLKDLFKLLQELQLRPTGEAAQAFTLRTLDDLSRDRSGWNKLREDTFNKCRPLPDEDIKTCEKHSDKKACAILIRNKQICNSLMEARINAFQIYSGMHSSAEGEDDSDTQ
jgi:hypothetical protein